jgi:hypothetical protein
LNLGVELVQVRLRLLQSIRDRLTRTARVTRRLSVGPARLLDGDDRVDGVAELVGRLEVVVRRFVLRTQSSTRLLVDNN